MILETHILQNFPPSNLNRDDVGAPKDCVYGDVRRARVSSQCLKRRWRDYFRTSGAFQPDNLAIRTNRLAIAVGEILAKDHDPALAQVAATRVLHALNVESDEADKTKVSLFVPERHVRAFAGLLHEHWDALQDAKKVSEPPPSKEAGKSKAKAKTEKSDGALPKDLRTRALALLGDVKRTPEIAWGGRMIAAKGLDVDVEAACHVAHAISTHAIETDHDFFTMLDDLRPAAEKGSAHMDTSALIAPCLYRYAALHVPLLRSNLEDDALVVPTVEALLRASIEARPTGKQASTAPDTFPSYVLVVAHEGQAQSLVNAFVRPVRGTEGQDIVSGSIVALERHYARHRGVYGDRPKERAWAFQTHDATREGSSIVMLPSMAELLRNVAALLGPEGK